MAHKKVYKVDGDEVAKYNKKYYQKYKNKLNARAKRRLVLNPDINKDYYASNKEHINELNKKNYRKNREKILKQKKEAKKKKRVSIVLM